MPRNILLAALTLFIPSILHAQSIATNSPTPLSTRIVDYTLAARITPAAHTLDATETLTYRNLTGQPLTTFPFHLYLNAFQPDSSFTTETHFTGGIRDSESEDAYPAKKLGSITLSALSADSFGDLLPTLRYIAPDDANLNDRTVALITLPRPVLPGQSITFHLAFHDLFPESVARNGYKRDFLMGGQWYPKLGVFWHGTWNCHQYHADTEFFSDFATFNVSLTLPRNFIVGATGVPTADHTNPDNTHTLNFYAEDVHDFAFALSPHFTVLNATYLSALGPVQLRVLTLAAHPAAGPRYRDILLASLRQFEDRYGPYPYKILTLIDPEPGSNIGGMEYPTLITGDANLLDPTLSLEVTAEHEFGHQYWYGMVATNEFEDAWLDEGINSYTEVAVTGAILGPRTSLFRRPWASFGDASAHFYEYLLAPNYDPVTRHAWLFHSESSYGGITYGKSSTLLATLEGIVGKDTMDQAMRTYFQRYKFQHPTTEDFLQTIEEVAIQRGRTTGLIVPFPPAHLPASTALASPDGSLGSPSISAAIVNSGLRPFFNQAVYGTAILDYAVDSITYTPIQWWLPDSDPKQDPRLRNTVTIHRLGDFLLPADLELIWSDGTRTHEHWAPAETENTRWHTYTYLTTAHILSAELDPQHTILLDIDKFNNSRTLTPNPIPARKLSNLWLTTQQAASQLAGWLI